MNRLVIIGNGFDLAHGLKTSYKDFISWYLDSVFNIFYNEDNIWQQDIKYTDTILNISMDTKLDLYNGNVIYGLQEYKEYTKYTVKRNSPIEFLEQLSSINGLHITKSILLTRILTNIETKGWTDIESDYYALLKDNADNLEACKRLNDQMDFLRDKLAEYLKTQKTEKYNEKILYDFCLDISEEDVSQSTINELDKFNFNNEKQNHTDFYTLKDLMVLDFNYTSTTEMYTDPKFINHIHGSLDKPEYIIFGYGDEMDKDFQELEDKNENELLKNSKSIKYLETDNYRRLLQFIEGGDFQVYIMGHSCGNSDRTLLHTIFEHRNCISIKPFYYKWGEGENEDTYSDITRNIYRNFKDKTLFRDRVVNKKQCRPLPQASK